MAPSMSEFVFPTAFARRWQQKGLPQWRLYWAPCFNGRKAVQTSDSMVNDKKYFVTEQHCPVHLKKCSWECQPGAKSAQ